MNDAQETFDRFHALIEKRDFQRAQKLVDDVLRADPLSLLGRYARGELALFQRDFALAEQEMLAVIEKEPGYSAAHHNLGVIAQWQQQYEQSITHFRRAFALASGAARGHTAVALSHSLMALGNYREGWTYYEFRPGGLMEQPRHAHLWDGRPLPAAAVAVVGEQGLGDVLQFCRYLPALRARVSKLYLVVDGPFAALAPLLASLAGVDAIITDRASGPAIARYCLVTTAAHIAGASLANPGPAAYLRPPLERVRAWEQRLAQSSPMVSPVRRVGLVWGGSPRAGAREWDTDLRRSIDPSLLQVLSGVPGIEWHSLQVGPAARNIDRLDAAFHLRDNTQHMTDFAETAACIANMDLVITVDTSVAHAAGAIGAPVWMLNRFDTCWRWGPRGATTPWYPSMRIFRQRSFGEWHGVVSELREALAAWRASPMSPAIVSAA